MNFSAKDSVSVCHVANFEFPATPNTFLLYGTSKNNGHLKTDFFKVCSPEMFVCEAPGHVCRSSWYLQKASTPLLRKDRWRSSQVVMHPADMIFLSVQSEAPSHQIPYTWKTLMWTSMLEKSRWLSSPVPRWELHESLCKVVKTGKSTYLRFLLSGRIYVLCLHLSSQSLTYPPIHASFLFMSSFITKSSVSHIAQTLAHCPFSH